MRPAALTYAMFASFLGALYNFITAASDTMLTSSLIKNHRLVEQRKLRTYPGFRVLCEHDPEYQDIFDETFRPPDNGSISSLASLVRFWPSTGVEPIFLHKRWHLSKIPFANEGDHRAGEQGLNEPAMNERMETVTTRGAQSNLDNPKTARSTSSGIKPEQSMTPEETGAGFLQTKGPRHDSPVSRMLGNDSGRKRRHSEMEPGYKRKSVCVRCWERRALCSFDSQCKNCRDNGVQRIR